MQFAYPVSIKDDGAGNHLVTFRDIPFAATEGSTFEDAVEQARDCLETAIAAIIKDREEIPPPSRPKTGEYQIRVPAQTAAKTALYIAIQKSGLSNSELARRLNINEKEIRRMLDPWHQTKLPRIETALAALGCRLTISIEYAA